MTQMLPKAMEMQMRQQMYPPQYEADEGALTKAQIDRIKETAPKIQGGTVRSALSMTIPPTAPSLTNLDR
jgi:hypothetical protein